MSEGPPQRSDRTPGVTLGATGVSAADVLAVARHHARVTLSDTAQTGMQASARIVADLSAGPEPVYGISTGFGSLASVMIAPERRADLQRALVRSHAAGMGPPIETEVVRAMMFLRARTLAMGRSGARPILAETILAMLNAGLTPVVPEHGSVGRQRRPGPAGPLRAGADRRGRDAARCTTTTRCPPRWRWTPPASSRSRPSWPRRAWP